MKPNELLTDERAISPVVGVALLIAITVILATVIGAVVLGLGPGGASAPQADAIANYSTANNQITIEHRGGDPLTASNINVSDESGNEIPLSSVNNASLSDGELTAGESVTITDSQLPGLASGDTVTLVWESPNGDKEVVVKTFEP